MLVKYKDQLQETRLTSDNHLTYKYRPTQPIKYRLSLQLKNMEKDSEKPLPTTTVLPDNIDKAKESMMTNSQNRNDELDKNKLSPEEVAILLVSDQVMQEPP